ncbi:MAG: (E)-4-hydroxy-3-methylbut-2-enyl-diphosphate synthase [Bacteroidota bacterium]
MFLTKEIYIGNVPLGGKNPIRIQSMTNTNTMDTGSTVDQIIRINNAGADYVRVSVPSVKDAENIVNIKQLLKKNGCIVPIIADIHFNPEIAEIAARYSEKIRINPGNFIDNRLNRHIAYSYISYNEELNKIREKLKPIIKTCKKYNTAVRIGVNHGSLGPRILYKYGDTPEGMVESAIEYIRIFEEEKFDNLVISMKSSNIKVMVESSRQLVERMIKEGMNYPQHLGVTEAGEGEEGRIKSATGIGILLSEGIGDTIRVSLTEDPENEIPVAKQILSVFSGKTKSVRDNLSISSKIIEKPQIKAGIFPIIILEPDSFKKIDDQVICELGYMNFQKNNRSADYVYLGSNPFDFIPKGDLKVIVNYCNWKGIENTYPLFSSVDYLEAEEIKSSVNFLNIYNKKDIEPIINKLKTDVKTILIAPVELSDYIITLKNKFDLINPVCFRKDYCEGLKDIFQITAACDFSRSLYFRQCNGVWISNSKIPELSYIRDTILNIFQATGTKITRNEYVSCPTCARTTFDIQKVVAEVKKLTSHFSGKKIAIMGCIVNGPGEMAGSDFGYVGTGKGMVSLYRGQEIIYKNVPESQAVKKLLDLINETIMNN